MATFCLDEQRVEAWFEMDGGGRVHYQLPTEEDMKSIRKQTSKKKFEFRRIDGKPERVEWEEVNEDLRNELFWDLVIMEWENFFDSKGNPIECTRANKMRLLVKSQRFLDFSNESFKSLKDLEKDRAEEAEKNLQTG